MEVMKAKVPQTHWKVTCRDKHGKVKWVEEYKNIVCDGGINNLIDKFFKGAGYTAAWYLGLVEDNPTFAAGDTMLSHAGWTEFTDYSELVRPALVLGAVASKSADNTATKATFTVTVPGTIAGTFLTSSPVKSGTAGVLYSEALFLAGDQAVIVDDELEVSCSVSGA